MIRPYGRMEMDDDDDGKKSGLKAMRMMRLSLQKE